MMYKAGFHHPRCNKLSMLLKIDTRQEFDRNRPRHKWKASLQGTYKGVNGNYQGVFILFSLLQLWFLGFRGHDGKYTILAFSWWRVRSDWERFEREREMNNDNYARWDLGKVWLSGPLWRITHFILGFWLSLPEHKVKDIINGLRWESSD